MLHQINNNENWLAFCQALLEVEKCFDAFLKFPINVCVTLSFIAILDKTINMNYMTSFNNFP